MRYSIYPINIDPRHPLNNPDGRRIQEFKKVNNVILDHTGYPIYLWFYDFLYWFGLLGFLYDTSIGSISPEEQYTSITPDISDFLGYPYYYYIYYYNETEIFLVVSNIWDAGWVPLHIVEML